MFTPEIWLYTECSDTVGQKQILKKSQGNPYGWSTADVEQDINQIATKIHLIFMTDFQDGV